MAKTILTSQEQKLILQAIKEAELNTSGEVQVHIENKCKKPVMDRAAEVFALLSMHKTKLRNGVLFYLAIEDRQFAILGDSGINAKVSDNFWEEIRNNMQRHFREGRFAQGLEEGIREAGSQLQKHFPYEKGDENELSDEISFGKE